MNQQSTALALYLRVEELTEWARRSGTPEFLIYLLDMVRVEASFQFELARRCAECVPAAADDVLPNAA